MTDDANDDVTELDHPADYQDMVSQRAMAFCHVAKLADSIRDESIKEECLVMLKKLNTSIKAPSTAAVVSIEGRQGQSR